MLAAIIF